MSSIKEQLQSLYWDKELSVAEIAAVFGRSYAYIHKRMVKYEIPRRKNTLGLKISYRHRTPYWKGKYGEGASNWKGGR